MYICEHWESLSSFLTHIASSGEKKLGPNHSITNRSGFAGDANVQEFVRQCQTLQRADFAERANSIDRLADTLAGDLPAGVTLRRQPAWGRSGSSVNVHKVLRGDLGHAWRRTVRQATMTAGSGDLVILLPSVVAAVIDHDQLQWSAVATLALADYARRSGRRVELWSMGYMARSYDSGNDYVWCVPLMRAGQSWDMSGVCLATYPEWLRRLGFRALEMTVQKHGAIAHGYGTQLRGTDLLQWAHESWAPEIPLAPASLIVGCCQEDRVRNRDSAERWVRDHLASLAQAA